MLIRTTIIAGFLSRLQHMKVHDICIDKSHAHVLAQMNDEWKFSRAIYWVVNVLHVSTIYDIAYEAYTSTRKTVELWMITRKCLTNKQWSSLPYNVLDRMHGCISTPMDIKSNHPNTLVLIFGPFIFFTWPGNLLFHFNPIASNSEVINLNPKVELGHKNS